MPKRTEEPILIEDIPYDPDMIQDYLRRERKRELDVLIIQDEPRPFLELELPLVPLFPPREEDKQDSDDVDRGVTIIQII